MSTETPKISASLINEALLEISIGNSLKDSPFFRNNINLLNSKFLYSYTDEEIEEFIRCKNNISRFASHISLNKGKISLRSYQENLLTSFSNYNFNINMTCRQSGMSFILAIHIVNSIVFNTDHTILLISNNLDSSIELINKIKQILESLPYFLKPQIVSMDKTSIKFNNGCRIISKAASPDSIAGYRVHQFIIDNAAYITPKVFEKMTQIAFPSMFAVEDSKVIINSTPNGYNHFYKLYTDAISKKNSFNPTRVDWFDVPGRDEDWMKREIANLGSIEAFNQEYGNCFISK